MFTLHRLPLAVLAAVALPLVALAEPYPIEIDHAFGTTVVTEKPERIATVNWANHEVPLALGVVPVGFAAANFGDDDDDGLLPWVAARLVQLGADVPRLFDEGDGIDFEAVAATQPDVILAAYSGLSQSDYDTLSRIAPVVAYATGPWSADWREMILMNSAGMGMADEGKALVEELEQEIARLRDAHPEFSGKKAMFVTHLSPANLSRISFYTDLDNRVQLFSDLGFTSPDMIASTANAGSFVGEVSAERIDELADVDVFVTYGGDSLLQKLAANILTSRLPAVERNAIVMLGNDPLGTAANPTPLSLPWALQDYVQMLAEAVRNGE